MNATVANGAHDASSISSSITQEDGQKQPRSSAHSPPTTDTDALESAEAPQSFNDAPAILPADLAIAVSDDLQQASSRQRSLSEAQDQASYYWDASTMAPLNPVSAVSIVDVSFP